MLWLCKNVEEQKGKKNYMSTIKITRNMIVKMKEITIMKKINILEHLNLWWTKKWMSWKKLITKSLICILKVIFIPQDTK